MKKPGILLSGALLALLLSSTSCQQDGCELTGGSWKAVSTDVASDKLRPSMVALTQAEILNTNYTFRPDGSVVQTGSSESPEPKTGTWKWRDGERTRIDLSFAGYQDESYLVKSCSEGSLVLAQRIPQDTTQPALLSIETVFQRAE